MSLKEKLAIINDHAPYFLCFSPFKIYWNKRWCGSQLLFRYQLNNIIRECFKKTGQNWAFGWTSADPSHPPAPHLRPKAHVCPDFFTNLFLFFSYLFFSIVKLSQRMYVQLKTSPKFVHRCVSLCNIKSLINLYISIHFSF